MELQRGGAGRVRGLFDVGGGSSRCHLPSTPEKNFFFNDSNFLLEKGKKCHYSSSDGIHIPMDNDNKDLVES